MSRLILGVVAGFAVAAGLAYAAGGLSSGGNTFICANSSNGVNVRVVESADDCRAYETAHELVGPGGSVSHADTADHATDADNLGGRPAAGYLHGFLRESATFTVPGGGTVVWGSNCNPGMIALSFGVEVTNRSALTPRPQIVSDGGQDPRNWVIVVQNNDPDTPMETFAHSQCFDDPDAAATLGAFRAAGPTGPIAQGG